MLRLNLPSFDLRVIDRGGTLRVFDPWRRVFVRLTPEEWVRQHFLRYLVDSLGFPAGLLAVEYSIEVGGVRRRCDAVAFDRSGRPLLIVELKAPSVRLTQRVLDQVAVYNHRLRVGFFMVSNGMEHHACSVDTLSGRYRILPSLPTYSQLTAADGLRAEP